MSSFLTDEEELNFKATIEKELGFELPHVCGYKVLVKLHLKENKKVITNKDGTALKSLDGNDMSIILPDSVVEESRYTTCTGLVLAMGSQAYTDKMFKGSERWCKVGDFVLFPRNDGEKITYRGVPMLLVPDNCISAVIEDPNYVTRG